MMKQLRPELHRIAHSWLTLGLLALLLILNVVVNSRNIIGVWNFYYPDSPYYDLCTSADFASLFEENPKRSFEEKRADYAPAAGEDAQDASALYPYTAEAAFSRIMWFMGGLTILCAALPALLAAFPLHTGMPRLAVKLGASPKRTAWAKILVYFALALLISLIGALIQCGIYAGAAVKMLGFGFVLRGYVLRLLMDCMVLSIPLYLAFALKSPVLSTVLNLIYGILCYVLNVVSARGETLMFIPFPPCLHGQWLLWKPETGGLWALLAAVVCIVYIALFSWLSVRAFERRCKEESA